jgi:hypothetical protein
LRAIDGEGSDQELAKGEFHKAVERFAASFDPGTEQSALVCVKQEGGYIGRLRLVGDLPLCLRVGDRRLEIFGPLPIQLPQAFTDRLALIGQFGAEAAENAIPREMRIRVQRTDAVEMTPQPLQRRHGWIGQNLTPLLIGAVALHDFDAERLLTFEMIIERTLWNARSVRNVLHTNSVKALFDQALQAGLNDLFAVARS